MGIQLNGNNDNISAVDGDLSITGIVTFSQLDVGNNIKIGNAGVITATSLRVGGIDSDIANSSADDAIFGRTDSGDTGITIFTGGGSTGRIFFGDGHGSHVDRMGTINYSHVDDVMSFGTNGNNERLRITSTGKLLIGHNSSTLVGVGNTYSMPLQVIGNSYDTAGIVAARYAADANGPTMHFVKSRNATKGSQTIVQVDDTLGFIRWYGSDGTDTTNAAAMIGGYCDATPASDKIPGRLSFWTTDTLTYPRERLRITSDGTLTKYLGSAVQAAFGGSGQINGITALPSMAGSPLVVGRDTGTTRSAHFGGHLQFDSGYGIQGTEFSVYGNTNGLYLNSNVSGDAIIFQTHNGSSVGERLRIDQSGKLRFGVSTAQIELQTSDGSDNGYLNLSGGGACSQGRGAQVVCYGNEYNGQEGRLVLLAGQSGHENGVIDFYTSGSKKATINNSGCLHIGDVGYGSDNYRLDVEGGIACEGSGNGTGRYGTIYSNFGGDSGNRQCGSYTIHSGQMSMHGTGNRYMHIKFDMPAGAMWYMKIEGYEYNGSWTSTVNGASVSNDKVHYSLSGGYMYAGQALFNGKAKAHRGITPVWYLHGNDLCVYIDTVNTGTGNRWGFYRFSGGHDGIVGRSNAKPIAIVAYSFSSSTSNPF